METGTTYPTGSKCALYDLFVRRSEKLAPWCPRVVSVSELPARSSTAKPRMTIG